MNAYVDLVATLADNPGAIERILATHQPDAYGMCRAPGCGRPGYGTRCVEWPCPPAGLALRAHQHGRRADAGERP